MNEPVRIKDPVEWKNWQDKNTDGYGGACVAVAREVMLELDKGEPITDTTKLICDADDRAGTGGITGFMAGAVAHMVSGCHERGDEFRKAWNKGYGVPEDRGGVVNPAIVTIGE